MSTELSDDVVNKGPCPKCGSKDNLVTYADGHAHCYTPGCGYRIRASEGAQVLSGPGAVHQVRGGDLLTPTDYATPYRDLDKRKLKSATLRRYGYFIAKMNGSDVQVAPYFSQEGELANQKVRWPNKEFTVLKGPDAPKLGDCKLFGQQVYGDQYDRSVIITEGELDALSVAEVVDFKRPVVSLTRGAGSAAKDLKANYLWVDRFAEIILWFDDDEPGRAAAEECAKLFKVGKVRIARAAGFKDASDIKQAGQPGKVTETLYAATAWRPQGIVNAAASVRDVLAPSAKEKALEYPASMPQLQEMTGGIHLGEVAYHVAGTGIGKSTQLREIQYDLVHRQGVKIAVLSFEDTRRDMQLGLMSIHVSERLQLRAIPEDETGRATYDEFMQRVHHQVFSGGLVELFDPETAEWSMDAILGYVRYCAKALDCQVVFIDPLSFIAAGIGAGEDERRALDKIAMEVAKLCKELHIAAIIAHHLKRTQGVPHEEGAPTSLNELRSSGGLANFAMLVVGWERNNQAAGDSWRVTQARVLKPHRLVGKSGLADVLFYGENGRLVTSNLPFPPMGKHDAAEGDDGRHNRDRGFSPIAEY